MKWFQRDGRIETQTILKIGWIHKAGYRENYTEANDNGKRKAKPRQHAQRDLTTREGEIDDQTDIKRPWQ